MFLSKALTVAMLTVMMLFSHPVGAENQPVETETAGKVELVERTGVKLPLDAEFVDENGNTVTLGELIDRPTILIPNYFTCPNSCSINLANLAGALNRMKLEPGADYRVIALSFNHRETPPRPIRPNRIILPCSTTGFLLSSGYFSPVLRIRLTGYSIPSAIPTNRCRMAPLCTPPLW